MTAPTVRPVIDRESSPSGHVVASRAPGGRSGRLGFGARLRLERNKDRAGVPTTRTCSHSSEDRMIAGSACELYGPSGAPVELPASIWTCLQLCDGLSLDTLCWDQTQLRPKNELT